MLMNGRNQSTLLQNDDSYNTSECWYSFDLYDIMPCLCDNNCILVDNVLNNLHGDSSAMDCIDFNSLDTNAKNALVRRMHLTTYTLIEHDGSRLFQNCDLTNVTNIGHFNTAYVEKFDSMFENATLNINLDKWRIDFYDYSQSFSFDRMMYGLQVPDSDNFAPVDNWNIPLGASTTDFNANTDSGLNVCWQPDPSQTVAHLCECTLGENNDNVCVTNVDEAKEILNQGPCASDPDYDKMVEVRNILLASGQSMDRFFYQCDSPVAALYLSSRTARRL